MSGATTTAAEAVLCPRCRRTLAYREDGEVVIRFRDRYRVVLRDGEMECLRCRIVVDVLTAEAEPA